VRGGESLPQQVDVAVVGGGIVGSATAYFLERQGLQVALFEKGEIAGEQSGRNWGFVRQQGRDPAEVPMMMASNRLWTHLAQELETDVEWVQGGNLALTDDEATVTRYQEWARLAREFGLDTRVVGRGEIDSLLRSVRRSWRAGLYTASDGHANPVKATSAFAAAASALGAHVVRSCTVEAIETAGGRTVGVRIGDRHVRSATVVCAAGIWSARLASTAGVSIPQGIVKASVAATSAVPPLTSTGVWAGDLAFRQMRSGEIVLAAGGVAEVDVALNSWRHARTFLPMYLKNRQSFRIGLGGWRAVQDRRSMRHYRLREPRPTARAVTGSLETAQRWFPQLESATIKYAWAGYIDGTPDSVPIVEALARPSGLVIATGLSGHGFAMGPVLGRVIAGLVRGGKPEFDLRPFRLSRFTDGSRTEARAIL
jgi:glycine/D-amino acid oxidase-like deaminating enzyme